MILDEAQDQQNLSPPVMRKCGNFKQMLKDFYEWLEFDPNIGTAALTNTTSAADRERGGGKRDSLPRPPSVRGAPNDAELFQIRSGSLFSSQSRSISLYC